MQGSYNLPASYTTLTVLDTALEFLAELQTDQRVLAFCPVFTLKDIVHHSHILASL